MDFAVGDRVIVKKSNHVCILNEIVNEGGEGYGYVVWDTERHMSFTLRRNEIERYMAYPTILDARDEIRQDIAMGRM